MKFKSSPSDTAKFVARLLAVQKMPASEVPQFIALIHETLCQLDDRQSLVAAPSLSRLATMPGSSAGAQNGGRLFPSAKVQENRARRLAAAILPEASNFGEMRPVAKSSIAQMAAPQTAARSPVATAGISAVEASPDSSGDIPTPRRRGRPPGSLNKPKLVAKIAMPVLDQLEPDEIDVEPAAREPSRLLRRAAVTHHEPDVTIASPLTRPIDTHVRGIVKWYDGKTGKGALRLAGVGDVPLEAALLERTNIKRLYRDQEIEAEISDIDGKIRLTSIAVPGRPEALQLPNGLGDALFKRQPRPVVVEIKRDYTTKRRTSARREAEEVLGSSNFRIARPR